MNKKPNLITAFSIGLILCVLTDTLHAHGLANDRIADISHQIEHQPKDAILYLKRGRVALDSAHWKDALRDFEKAEQLNENLFDAIYWQGYAKLKQGYTQSASEQLIRYLKKSPTSPSGHQYLAQAYVLLGKYSDAANHYDLAIQYNVNAQPQVYVERVQALNKITPPPSKRIAKGIQDGIDILGPQINLLELMVETYAQAKQYKSAILWHTRYPQSLRNTPSWMLKHGQLYEWDDQVTEALLWYSKSIQSIALFTPAKQALPAYQNLKNHAQLRSTALLQINPIP